MSEDTKEIVKVDSIDEANDYLKKGWRLLDSGSFVVNNVPQFYFLVGKTTTIHMKEMIEKLEKEEKQKVVPFSKE